MSCLVEIYRHVGERVRMDLGKKGLPQSRYDTFYSERSCLDVAAGTAADALKASLIQNVETELFCKLFC